MILRADTPVPAVHFRASVLDGVPAGRVEIERAAGTEIAALRPEVRIDGAGLVSVSLIPECDTAVTFLPIDRPGNLPLMIAGLALLLGALAWTAFDILGL